MSKKMMLEYKKANNECKMQAKTLRFFPLEPEPKIDQPKRRKGRPRKALRADTIIEIKVLSPLINQSPLILTDLTSTPKVSEKVLATTEAKVQLNEMQQTEGPNIYEFMEFKMFSALNKFIADDFKTPYIKNEDQNNPLWFNAQKTASTTAQPVSSAEKIEFD